MGKRIAFTIVTACVLLITGCGASNSAEAPAGADSQIVENAGQTDIEENIATDGVADYPAAIMVNDTVYLLEGNPMPAEVDESAIIGYTESYTDTFPENNGETNFNPELGMPYAQVEGGIAVLYKNEWYLGTPFSNENTITFTGIIIDHTVESLVPVVCVKTLEEEVDDAVITHELTVKFAEDGSFRYLGNKILDDGLSNIPEYQYRIVRK